MENKPLCKACSATVHVADEEISKAIERLAKLKGMKFVEDALYERRLEICSECQYLEYDTTCLQCGCIVQIKAKLPDSYCPFPKNKKW